MTSEVTSNARSNSFQTLISELLPPYGDEFVSIAKLWKHTPQQLELEESLSLYLDGWHLEHEVTPESAPFFLNGLRKSKRELYERFIDELLEVYLSEHRHRNNFGELTVPSFPTGRTLPETDWTLLEGVNTSKKVIEAKYTSGK